MTKRIKQLKRIVELTKYQEEIFLQRLGQINQQQCALENKLKELEQYRLEYEQARRDYHQQSISSQKLVHMQQFLQHLEVIIKHQKHEIEQIAEQVNAQRQEWFQATSKRKAIEKKYQESQLEHDKNIEKKEQQALLDIYLSRR